MLGKSPLSSLCMPHPPDASGSLDLARFPCRSVCLGERFGRRLTAPRQRAHHRATSDKARCRGTFSRPSAAALGYGVDMDLSSGRSFEFQPRSVGELISDAIAQVRSLLRPLAFAALPFCVVELLFREGANVVNDRIRGLVVEPDQIPSVLVELATHTGASVSLLVGSILAAQLIASIATLASARARFGQRVSPATLIRSALRRAPAVFGTQLLWGGLFVAALVLPPALLGIPLTLLFDVWGLGIALILGALSSLLLAIVLGLRWALWLQVLVLEGRAGFRALSRSAELMRHRGGGYERNPKLRLSVLYIVYFMIASSLQSLFAMPILIQGFTQSPPFSSMSLWNLPIALVVPIAAFQVVTNAVVMPLSGVLGTLFYYDLRVRYEGLEGPGDEASVP